MDYQRNHLKMLERQDKGGKLSASLRQELHKIRWYMLYELEERVAVATAATPTGTKLAIIRSSFGSLESLATVDKARKIITDDEHDPVTEQLELLETKQKLLEWLREICSADSVPEEYCRWLLHPQLWQVGEAPLRSGLLSMLTAVVELWLLTAVNF